MISVSLVGTVILVSAENRKDANELAEIELAKLKKWLDVNVLSPNVLKTKSLTFVTSPSCYPTLSKYTW